MEKEFSAQLFVKLEEVFLPCEKDIITLLNDSSNRGKR